MSLKFFNVFLHECISWVGVTKPISSVPLFSYSISFVKTDVNQFVDKGWFKTMLIQFSHAQAYVSQYQDKLIYCSSMALNGLGHIVS